MSAIRKYELALRPVCILLLLTVAAVLIHGYHMGTTAENIAVAFWKILAPKITEGKLYSIRLYESQNNIVEYRGD